MRTSGCVSAFLGLLLAVLPSAASGSTPDLGSRRPRDTKTAGPLRHDGDIRPAPADNGLPQGEDIADALVIPALPFSVTGETCAHLDDYDAACDYASISPDVVFAYTAVTALRLDIDLCGSGFDTKLFVLDGAATVLYCNEDTYGPGDPCGTYVSRLDGVPVAAGQTVYIVVDGFAGACGDFELGVTEFAPCAIACAGEVEGEPTLHDGYVDRYNGGCNSPNLEPAITTIQGDAEGNATFCGRSGFYVTGGDEHRDTDWFAITLGPTGQVIWSLDAAEVTVGYVLQLRCPQPGVYGVVVGGRCDEGSIAIVGSPGANIGLWVAPPVYVPPLGMDGQEYEYRFTLSGLSPHRAVATDVASWGSVKSRFR